MHRTFLVLLLLSSFWATASFAQELGQGRAAHLETERFASVPGVIVYARNRLTVDAADVQERVLAPAFAPYRYRYSGWKLLVRTDRQMVLIPFSWSTANAYALIVPVNDDSMIEFAPHF